MAGALEGLLILDFSTLLPGPMATLFLADAGAEVVKIERPGSGEEMRQYDPKWGVDSINFAMLNRGKKSLALDLKNPDERAVLDPLIARADVLVEQFRPGVMDRLGLGYDAVRSINPDIIYCSITGYGQAGPKANRAGHDLNYIGDTGLLSLGMGPAGAPVVPPALIADIAAGSYPAMINILLALRARDAGKGGAYLDIAMAENLFPFMYWALGEGQATGQWPGNGDALVTGGSPRYRLYPTADGKVVAAAPIEEKFWQSFVDAIGLDQALRDDTADPAATTRAIAQRIAGKPASYWRDKFETADCCCTIVRTVEEALDDPHFAARGVFSRKLANQDHAPIRGLPTPISKALAVSADGTIPAPQLGASNPNFEGSAT